MRWPVDESDLHRFVVDETPKDMPTLSVAQRNRVDSLQLVGTAAPSDDAGAKELMRKLVADISPSEWALAEGDAIAAHPHGAPVPDTFVMDANCADGVATIDGLHAWAASAGVLDWRRRRTGREAKQPPLDCVEVLLEACPWRETAVVIVLSARSVQVFRATRSPEGRRQLLIRRSERRSLCVTDKTGTIARVDRDGLALLSWGLSCMRTAALPASIARALRVPECTEGAESTTVASEHGTRSERRRPLYADTDPRLMRSRWLGVGGSATVCEVEPAEGSPYCLKMVWASHGRFFENEPAALQAIRGMGGASFPRLVAYDVNTRRLLTTPVAETARARSPTQAPSAGRLAPYAAVVDDLKRLHTALDRRVFHCDVAPHNFMWRRDRLVLIDFGCAVVARASTPSDLRVRYAGSTWYASTSALKQLIETPMDSAGVAGDADSGSEREVDGGPNTFGRHVRVDASFDLEGLAKSVAAREVPGVREFVEGESRRLHRGRRPAPGFVAHSPQDVVDEWSRAFDKVPLLRALGPAFEAARNGDHDGLANALRTVRFDGAGGA